MHFYGTFVCQLRFNRNRHCTKRFLVEFLFSHQWKAWGDRLNYKTELTYVNIFDTIQISIAIQKTVVKSQVCLLKLFWFLDLFK